MKMRSSSYAGKPRGVLSAADSSGQESMASLLAPRTVFPVHRLDRDVPA